MLIRQNTYYSHGQGIKNMINMIDIVQDGPERNIAKAKKIVYEYVLNT